MRGMDGEIELRRARICGQEEQRREEWRDPVVEALRRRGVASIPQVENLPETDKFILTPCSHLTHNDINHGDYVHI
jgi:hypothetical protein